MALPLANNARDITLGTLPALLRSLGVDNAPVTRQRAALTAWLAHNTPNETLALSFRVNGYGLLLPPAARHHGPAGTYARTG